MTNLDGRIHTKMRLFAGISERQRTTTTLWPCLHTAEDAGSIPASPTCKSRILQAKRKCKERLGPYTRPFLHQSNNFGPYVGWRRAGALPGGWVGVSRAGG